MIFYEKIMLGLIFGIIGIHIIVPVIVPAINSQIVEMKPIPVVKVTGMNATSERKMAEGPEPPVPAIVEHSMVIPERPSVATVMRGSLNNLGFAFLVAFTGVGVWLPWEEG